MLKAKVMNTYTKLLSLITLPSAVALLAAGCKTPVTVTGSYALPGTNITATIDLATNGATLGGNYQTGTTNIGGTIKVGQ